MPKQNRKLNLEINQKDGWNDVRLWGQFPCPQVHQNLSSCIPSGRLLLLVAVAVLWWQNLFLLTKNWSFDDDGVLSFVGTVVCWRQWHTRHKPFSVGSKSSRPWLSPRSVVTPNKPWRFFTVLCEGGHRLGFLSPFRQDRAKGANRESFAPRGIHSEDILGFFFHLEQKALSWASGDNG